MLRAAAGDWLAQLLELLLGCSGGSEDARGGPSWACGRSRKDTGKGTVRGIREGAEAGNWCRHIRWALLVRGLRSVRLVQGAMLSLLADFVASTVGAPFCSSLWCSPQAAG